MIKNFRKYNKLSTVAFVLSTIIISIIGLGCGSNSVTPPSVITETSNQIVYSRFRDNNGNVAEVFSEGTGFDGRDVDSPDLVFDKTRINNDDFMLFYEAADAGGSNTIGLVTSTEEDFTIIGVQRQQVIGLGAGGSGFETGATDPTVIADSRIAEVTRKYKIWFEGRNGSTSTIIYATSADGISWTGFTKCTGLTPSFGSVRVADPTVLLDGTTYKMWFEAINSTSGGTDGAGSIGYAESTDGIAWTVKDASGNSGSAASAVFTQGISGQFDGYSVNAPDVLIDTTVAVNSPHRYKMWYEAGDNATNIQNTLGYATSSNGLTWNRSTLPILLPSSDNKVPLPFDSGDLEHPTAAIIPSIAVNVEGHYLLWYTGDGEGGASPNRIGLVKGYTL